MRSVAARPRRRGVRLTIFSLAERFKGLFAATIYVWRDFGTIGYRGGIAHISIEWMGMTLKSAFTVAGESHLC